jgi:DNA gyrase subunit B
VTKANKKTINQYTAEEIQVLEGLEPVRKRPGMYIGSTDTRGLHHLVTEIIDNSVDEAIAGYASNVYVIIQKDNKVTIYDDGRGIPVETHKKTGLSALEVAMTKLHAGAKFSNNAYQASGGLHGIGASAVNALSSWLKVEVIRNKKLYTQEYKQGKPKTKVKEGKVPGEKGFYQNPSGTKTTFLPDPAVFKESREFSFKRIKLSLRERAYLVAGVFFHLYDKRNNNECHFYFDGGIKSLVKHLNKGKKTIHPIIYAKRDLDEFDFPIGAEVALQYNEGFAENVVSFANVINTPDGGTHLTGFRTALTKAVKDYVVKKDLLKGEKGGFVGDDLKEGLTAVVFLKMPASDIQFESQTKTKLNNPEAQSAVYTVTREALDVYFEEHPNEARKILEKVVLAAKARMAARAAKDAVIRKGALEGMTLPGKLADCQQSDPSKSEIYIVEGDSAGGCFSDDTKIALTDGRNVSFTKLIQEDKKGKKNYCYTILETGQIGVGKITNPRKTKKNTNVIKIILDNNQEIICTPDHLFMLNDGSYKKAEHLTKKDSLMPLYRKLSKIKDKNITIDGSEMVYDVKKKKWVFTHILADKYNLEHKKYKKLYKYHKHHKDFNKLNNNPDNIERLPKNKHLRLCQRFFDNNKKQMLEAVSCYNHKIKKIIKLKTKIDVYDLEVPETHNFALASGIFVHNSAKQGRDRKFQAILPLGGKILNTERARLDKIIEFDELKALIIALGTGIGETFDIEKLRYHRVVIMCDADVDGEHIATLLLTFFYRHLKPVVDQGYLYIALPPLYKIQIGKEIHYAYNEEQKKEVFAKNKDKKIQLQRYKGLGEMNPNQLWETTMDPQNRILKKVQVEDAVQADQTFNMLMGQEVPPRRKFIQTHAKMANLDI